MGRVVIPHQSIAGYLRATLKHMTGWPIYEEPIRVYSRATGNFKAIGWEISSSKYDVIDYHIIVLDSELKKW